ncbi:MAG: PhzF family phenazine biosynthesis protein, partial [Gammaproteobacteria bacterium]|nr:PhzF family phenazine biosynthesis protein [Gammaproteobacteria bacterium]
MPSSRAPAPVTIATLPCRPSSSGISGVIASSSCRRARATVQATRDAAQPAGRRSFHLRPIPMDCTIVDVFAERPLGGNPLAVVRDCADLSAGVMLAIAREMNLSETTFVVDEDEDQADVRIFTPAQELPFAGHPTLGTAWVLARDRGRDDYTLHLPAGAVAVRFGVDGIAWMEPPDTEPGPLLPADDAAALVGVAATDLDDRIASRLARIGGTGFAFVGVRTWETLARVRVNAEVHARIQPP